MLGRRHSTHARPARPRSSFNTCSLARFFSLFFCLFENSIDMCCWCAAAAGGAAADNDAAAVADDDDDD